MWRTNNYETKLSCENCGLKCTTYILKKKKKIEQIKSKVWLVLELPLGSFVSLEPAWVIADDRVAGDLYNPVQSRGWMAAGRRRGRKKEKNKNRTVCIFDGREIVIVQSDQRERGLPGWSHQASSAVSHPAVIREISFLGARPTVLPLQHHLSARAERLERRWGGGSYCR